MHKIIISVIYDIFYLKMILAVFYLSSFKILNFICFLLVKPIVTLYKYEKILSQNPLINPAALNQVRNGTLL